MISRSHDEKLLSRRVDMRIVPGMLIDPGPGERLREPTKRDQHPEDHGCVHCRQVCCLHCYKQTGSTKVWRGLTGFGRHVQAKHPHAFGFTNQETALNRTRRHLAELRLAKELEHIKATGLRKVPIANITPHDAEALTRYIQNVRRQDQNALLLGAIELAEDAPKDRAQIQKKMRALSMEIERGVKLGHFTTTTHVTHYDPRIFIEILKLSWALNRSWSFVIHLLLLYGMNAMAENLAVEGLTPPVKIARLPSSEKILDHTRRKYLRRAVRAGRK